MADLAKGAVDSVLGTIGAAIGDEAKRLGSVRRDMQFIKDEMESMNGFLLDVADPADQSNQVRAWMKQVREVAYNSQSCIDRYVQTVGAGRASAGLLGSIRRVPRAVWTVRDRHRIAGQIRQIRSRAQEVGERRLRYGVQAPPGAARLPQEAEEDDAGRRRALADALRLCGTDEPKVMAWLNGGGDEDDVPRMPLKKILRGFLSKMMTSGDLQLELASMARQVLDKKDPENVEDADVIISKQGSEITEMETRVLLAAMKELIGFPRRPSPTADSKSQGGAASHEQHGSASPKIKAPLAPAPAGAPSQDDEINPAPALEPPVPPTPVVDPLEGIKRARTPAEIDMAERHYSSQLTHWLKGVFNEDIIEELVLCNGWLKDVLGVVGSALGKAAEMLPEAGENVTHMGAQVGKAATGISEMWKSALSHIPALSVEAREEAERYIGSTAQSVKEFLINKTNDLTGEVGKEFDGLLRDFAWLTDILFHGGAPRQGGLRPRLLAIVTPPADVAGPEDQDRPATKMVKAVCKLASESQQFKHVVWINAKLYSTRTERLQRLLQKLTHPLPFSVEDDEPLCLGAEMSTWDDKKLQEEIRRLLEGSTFLIVLADHEDDTPWKQIADALPPGQPDGKSTIIVTPVIQQPLHFHGWYIASWLFLLKASRYKVHFYSHVEALSKRANCLLVDDHKSEELQTLVKNILKKCRWDDDAFSTKLFLRALYANPRRSKNELVALLHELEEFNIQGNAREMIDFCYKDLPGPYKMCLRSLSMFPRKSIIRRGSLLRRWAAENLTTSRSGALEECERCFNVLVERGLVHYGDSGTMFKVHPYVFSFIAGNVGKTYVPKDMLHRLSFRNRKQLEQQQLIIRRHATHISNFWGRILCYCSTAPPVSHDSEDHEDTVTFLNCLPVSPQLGLIDVLDLEECPGLNENNLRIICNKLLHLKYLSLRKTEIEELPREIFMLEDLETFDIRETKIKLFPDDFHRLENLLHLLSGGYVSKSDGSRCNVRIPSKIGDMTKVQVLSHVEVLDSDDADELDLVGKLQQLRKLGVVVAPGKKYNIPARLLRLIGKLEECLCSLSVHIEAAAGGDAKDEFDMSALSEDQQIAQPRSLQSLKISGRIIGLPTWILKLHQLSKITLRGTSLSDGDINLLGKLVNLRTLVLGEDSADSNLHHPLTFKMAEFRQLEVLAVDGSVIYGIHFMPGAAPKLEKIFWKCTSRRDAVINGINALQSLKLIQLGGPFEMRTVKKELGRNPNHPVLKEILDDKHKAAATTSAGASRSIG